MSDDYQLIDFGAGRKLESVQGYLIDRPSPAAEGYACRLTDWSHADAVFDEPLKKWIFRHPWPNSLSIGGPGFRLPVSPTPYGHFQVFPEQRPHWQWLHQTASQMREQLKGQDLHALNLFAYTGGSTCAMATGGAKTVHVDAAKPNVTAAKLAAIACGLDSLPIRYLVDDALKFAKRELRRGRVYHLVALDPPAYGHSPDGQSWRIERDLEPLLRVVAELMCPDHAALLVTGHSQGFHERDLQALLEDLLTPRLATRGLGQRLQIERGRSILSDIHQRTLDAGFFVRFRW